MSDESIDRSLVTLLGAVLQENRIPEAEILLQLVGAAGFGHDLETRLAAWIEAADGVVVPELDDAEHPDAEFRSDEPPLDVAMRRIGWLERDIMENCGPIKRPTNEDAMRWYALVRAIRQAVEGAKGDRPEEHPDTERLRALAQIVNGGEMSGDGVNFAFELTLMAAGRSAAAATCASRLADHRSLDAIRDLADALRSAE